MKELTPAECRALRARAHHISPVVSISGNGLSASVLKEIDLSLKAHELIKIRIYGDDRELRNALMTAVCAELGCAPVQAIGKLLVVFRPEPKAPKETAISDRKKPKAMPRALKIESGRTARTTTGTSAARRFGAKSAARPAGGSTRPRGSSGRKPGVR